MLKLTDPDDRDAEHEAAALAAWDGDGAVRLLEHDPERGAFLLERLEPGTQAWELDEDEATLAVAGVLRRLHREPPTGHPFRHLADAGAGVGRGSARAEHGRRGPAGRPGAAGSSPSGLARRQRAARRPRLLGDRPEKPRLGYLGFDAASLCGTRGP